MVKLIKTKLFNNILAKLVAIAFIIAASAIVNVVKTSEVDATNGSYCECTNTYSDGTTKVEDGASVILFGDSNKCYCGGAQNVMKFAIDTFTIGVTVLATIGIIWTGYLIMSARDNEAQVTKAKRRMIEIVVGVLCFVLLDVVATLFMPGGAASNVPNVVSSSSERKDYPEMDVTSPQKETDSGSGGSSSGGSSGGGSSGGGSSGGDTAVDVGDAVWNNGNECSGAKIFPGKKYALTEEEIKYFSELTAIENCRSSSSAASTVLGCKLLATQIINLYEEREHDHGGKEGCSGGSCYYKNMKKWVTSDKWYHVNQSGGMRPGKYSNANSKQAVIDVIVNGNRVMPKFVSRYDGLYHWTEHRSGFKNLGSIEAASKAVPMKTIVKGNDRYLWCIERKQTSNKNNGPYNEVFNYDNNYRKAVGM